MLGNFYNLFGGTNAVSIHLSPGGPYRVEDVVQGAKPTRMSLRLWSTTLKPSLNGCGRPAKRRSEVEIYWSALPRA